MAEVGLACQSSAVRGLFGPPALMPLVDSGFVRLVA
jgi:hypothetical protein